MGITEAVNKAKSLLGTNFDCVSIIANHYADGRSDVDVYIHTRDRMSDGMRCVDGKSIESAIEHLERLMAVTA